MNKNNYSDFDGNTLLTFITVLEEASVSKAAVRLGVSQSAVSHTLDRLRKAFNDPLFVRDGRGIIATAKAQSLRKPVEAILLSLRSLTHEREFDPSTETLEFTIAANDFQLALIFPTLLKELYAEGINPKFHFIPSGVPSANLKRTSHCQMTLTPVPPDDKNIVSEKLFHSTMVCFYDAEVREPPKTWKQFINRRYVETKFSETEATLMVLPALDLSVTPHPTVTVPNFSLLQAFIKGTDMITIHLSLMSKTLMQDLDYAALPFKTKPVNMYLAWNRRDHDDPAHRWLRQRIRKTVDDILGE